MVRIRRHVYRPDVELPILVDRRSCRPAQCPRLGQDIARSRHGGAMFVGRIAIFLSIRIDIEENRTHQFHDASTIGVRCQMHLVFGHFESMVVYSD